MYHVFYSSLTGNTKRLAAAIAAELGVEARNVKGATRFPEDGVLFIGSGSYGDNFGDDLKAFFDGHDFAGRQVALFGTSGRGEGLEVRAMADALTPKGAKVLGCYHCKGKAFVVVNIGRPDQADLGGARQFARDVARQAGL